MVKWNFYVYNTIQYESQWNSIDHFRCLWKLRLSETKHHFDKNQSQLSTNGTQWAPRHLYAVYNYYGQSFTGTRDSSLFIDYYLLLKWPAAQAHTREMLLHRCECLWNQYCVSERIITCVRIITTDRSWQQSINICNWNFSSECFGPSVIYYWGRFERRNQ